MLVGVGLAFIILESVALACDTPAGEAVGVTDLSAERRVEYGLPDETAPLATLFTAPKTLLIRSRCSISVRFTVFVGMALLVCSSVVATARRNGYVFMLRNAQGQLFLLTNDTDPESKQMKKER